MKLTLSGGRLLDPATQLDQVADLHIADGHIVAHGRAPNGFQAERTLDAKGQIVIPGIIDLSVRLREPGQEHKGTIASETRAAAAGGITTVCVPPDTHPVIDTPAVAKLVLRQAREAGFARVLPIGALTKKLGGEALAEMALLRDQGPCLAISNACEPVKNTRVMRHAMEYAASCRLPVFLSADDPDLSHPGCAHEGAVSTRLGLPGIPEAAETVAVARELILVEQSGVSAHFLHITSARSVNMIAKARQEGLPVSMSVTPHHLHLTEMDIGYFDTRCHVLPPLRTQRDQDALRQGLALGDISAICSDHQPHDADAKLAPFAESEPGISGVETLLALTLRLVEDGVLPLADAIAKLTHQPARIMGLDDCGTLAVGSRADICIFDPQQHWRVNAAELLSTGKNTPFNAWELKGRVTTTLLQGWPVFELSGEINPS